MDIIQKQFNKNNFQKLIEILLIAGAINWGLVAYNGTDAVRFLAYNVGYPKIDTYIKLAVGLAGIYMLVMLILQFTKRDQK